MNEVLEKDAAIERHLLNAAGEAAKWVPHLAEQSKHDPFSVQNHIRRGVGRALVPGYKANWERHATKIKGMVQRSNMRAKIRGVVNDRFHDKLDQHEWKHPHLEAYQK